MDPETSAIVEGGVSERTVCPFPPLLPPPFFKRRKEKKIKQPAAIKSSSGAIGHLAT